MTYNMYQVSKLRFYDEAGEGLIPPRLYFPPTGTISCHGIRTTSILVFFKFGCCTAAPMKEHIRGQMYERRKSIPIGVRFL